MTDKPLSRTAELAKQCHEDSQIWFPGSDNIVHHSLALAGEVGEFCNIVKKIDRGSLDINNPTVRFDLMMELTDVYVYTLNLAHLLHMDLEQTYMHVRSNNSKRFTQQKRA